MPIHPHSPEWYDRLSTLQDGYFYPWKSRLAPRNGEDAYLELVQQSLYPEADVLDVGCGHGEVAHQMAPFCRHILAYDRIPAYIRMAQEAASAAGVENVTYLCADSSSAKHQGTVKIPANANAFDVMTSRRGPLHWLEDAKRVARPGATIIQLNPLETPLPPWADRLPEPLRSAAGIEYSHGMLNSVQYRLGTGSLELHSAWIYDVPEYMEYPDELYKRLTWGYIADEVPTWPMVQTLIEQIFAEYAGKQGLVMRHRRLLWTAVVEK